MEQEHDWLTLHRVRFSEAKDGTNSPLLGPEKADAWRFYPHSPVGENGFRDSISDVWGGIAIYSSREKAEAVLADPTAHIPSLSDAIEAWHALAVPITHRGGVNWRGAVQESSAITTAEDDCEGTLAVLTSAGYTNPGPDDFPRMKTFFKGVDAVVDYYGTVPGNLQRAVFSGAAVDQHDGITMSLWKDEAAMLAAAYGSGFHRDQLDSHRSEPMFDRSSFTRTKIIKSTGTWDGSNPVPS